MGKKVKVGKKRKDRFYHLAKETGYRARSAFKLIQLNRKYGFLQESRVLIDLCAAPGGWLQVASNFMPVSSIVIGIDLVQIKPIKNVITFQADITGEPCRQHLKKELKTWQADCVLNDGAPNVGSAWVQDAFTQAQLTLSALKLACEFLRPGGWFVTKVFRSKDYHPLVWVLKQLFKKVHATKPQASRNESAEIFVVCQGYLAPDKLDPKFLDPKSVFKDAQEEKRPKADVLNPEKTRRSRGGYADGELTLFKATKASEFITSGNPIDVLASTNELLLDDDKITNHLLTTEEIKHCCKDIKVLGKREIKSLLTWRKKLRKEFEATAKESSKDESEATEETKVDSDEEIANLVEQAKEEETKELKKKRRKVFSEKRKLREKLAKQHDESSGAFNTEEPDLFALKLIQNEKSLKKVDNVDADIEDVMYNSDDSEELEFESEKESGQESSDEEYDYYEQYGVYDENKSKIDVDLLEKKKKFTKDLKKKKMDGSTENPLIVDLESEKDTSNTDSWFKQDAFKTLDLDDDEDYDIEIMTAKYQGEGKKITGLEKDKPVNNNVTHQKPDEKEQTKAKKTTKKKKKESKEVSQVEKASESEESSSDEDSEIDDRSVAQTAPKEVASNRGDSFEVVKANTTSGGLGPKNMTAEALALGTALVTSRKRKRDIIDESFNRYSFGDEDLPNWFSADEARHTIRQIPVTKDDVRFYKDRLKEINARPMKKVIEAKARKKRKTEKKLERVRKKAEAISDTVDFSEKEKAAHIRSLYKKAGLLKKKTVEKTYVVAKKGLAGKRYRRPKGVAGPYKVVDPRQKKDMRGKMKAGKKGKTSKRGRK